MTIQIRQGEATDFEQVYALIKEFAVFQKTPEKVFITPQQMMEDEKYFNCFIALDEDKIIGFCTWFYAYYSWSGKAVYIDDLYVTQPYRSAGTGNMLLNKIIETAKSNNCKKVRWQVSKWNEKAIAFYKSRGAVIDDMEINCDLWLNDNG